MVDSIVPKISELDNPGGPLRRLSCFDEITEMIKRGELLKRILVYIQVERGEMIGVSEGALMRTLRDYRDYLLSDDSVLDSGQLKKKEFDDDADPLWALNVVGRNIRLMEERINMEVETEIKLNKLFSTTHREFLTLVKLCSEYMDKQDKLGVFKLDRSSISSGNSGTVVLPGRIDLNQILSSPESRQRIMKYTEAIIGDKELMETVGKTVPQLPGDVQDKDEKKKKNVSKKKVAKKKAVKNRAKK